MSPQHFSLWPRRQGGRWILGFVVFRNVNLLNGALVALAPLLLLMVKGAAWSDYSGKGMAWSLIAGIVGAIGAFGVLLAFGAGGKPGVVMSIVFAGAPVVNALFTLWQHPPPGGVSSIKLPFFLGIVLAALGGFLVTYYKPPAAAPANRSGASRRRA